MKRIFTLLTLVLISGMLYAQGPFTFGIKVGMNVAKMPTSFTGDTNLNGDKISKLVNDNMYGYQAGIFGRISIKKVIIQPEVYFSLKGGDLTYDLTKHDSASVVNSITKKVRISNIDIPIMLGYSFVDNPLFKLRVMGGPVASLLVKKEIEIKRDGVKEDFGKSDLNGLLWSIQLGAGIDVWKLTIDARYELGLNEINKETAESMKSRAFLLSLGFKLL
jgi:hypothetical protein